MSEEFFYNAEKFVDVKCSTVTIQQKRSDSGTLLAPSALIDEVSNRWFEPTFWQAKDAVTGTAVGRGTTYFLQHLGHQWVLRHYRRGGLIGRVIKDSFFYAGLTRSRTYQELALLNTMYHGFGLPCPKPIAGRVRRRGLFYRCDIIMERIADAQDVHQRLCRHPLDNQQWQNIGQTIRRFHDKQIFHHDLNIRNILIDKNDQVWLIDFDRCELRISDAWKSANLSRLRRSLDKEAQRNHQYHFTEQHWQALLAGYGSK